MPARSWDVWQGTQQAVEHSAVAKVDYGRRKGSASDWSLQRAGLATALVTVALLACATSARAEDGLGIAEAAGGQPQATVASTDDASVQSAGAGDATSTGAGVAAVPDAGEGGSDTIAPGLTTTAEPTETASTGNADATFTETATQTSEDVPAGGEAGDASVVAESADGATGMSDTPPEADAGGTSTDPVAADGAAAPPTNELATTPEPASPVTAADASGEAQNSAPATEATGGSPADAGTPSGAATTGDPVAETLDQTAGFDAAVLDPGSGLRACRVGGFARRRDTGRSRRRLDDDFRPGAEPADLGVRAFHPDAGLRADAPRRVARRDLGRRGRRGDDDGFRP